MGPGGVLGAMDYLVAHEVEIGRWEPLGVIEIFEWEQIGAAIAQLEPGVLPGLFRLVEPDGVDWFDLELAADGVVL